jgi:hypothetical protein
MQPSVAEVDSVPTGPGGRFEIETKSAALLADLFAVLYDQSNCYEHDWAVGDVVLWDNVGLYHGRAGFPATAARTLQRVTIGAYTPSELIPRLDELLGRS